MGTTHNRLASVQLPPTFDNPLVLPPRFENADPFTLPLRLREPVRKYLRNFEEYFELGVAPSFFGVAETWKTYSAAVVARWVAGAARVPTLFVDAGAEFLQFENARWKPTTTSRMNKLGDIPFLVLDDITNVRSKVAQSFLTIVAEKRFAQLLPTCYTGNYNFGRDYQQFAEEYSPSLARRIKRGSEGFLIVTG